MTAPRRITDATKEGSPAAYNEYSTRNPWNCDGTRAVLLYHDHVVEHNGWRGEYSKHEFSKHLHIGASSRPNWHPTDPKSLFFIEGNKLKLLNVATAEEALVKEFSDYAAIDTMGEGNMCGSLIALAGDGRKPFVYDTQTGTVRRINVQPRPIESLYLAPLSGKLLVSWVDPNVPMQLFGTGGQHLLDLPVNGHKAMGVLDGREVLVWCNSNDSSGPDKNPFLPACKNGIVRIDLISGVQTCLFSPSDWSLAYQISCGTEPFAIVSVYGNSQHMFAGKILRLPLAGGLPEVLCAHGSSARDERSQPKAVVSPDGNYVLFTSDMDGTVETYAIQLGEDAPIEPPPPPPPSVETSKAELLQDLRDLVTKHEGGEGN